jgi:uncharacterized YccA/Bax inhibitor family protein
VKRTNNGLLRKHLLLTFFLGGERGLSGHAGGALALVSDEAVLGTVAAAVVVDVGELDVGVRLRLVLNFAHILPI